MRVETPILRARRSRVLDVVFGSLSAIGDDLPVAQSWMSKRTGSDPTFTGNSRPLTTRV
jgi:hypothetical protein